MKCQIDVVNDFLKLNKNNSEIVLFSKHQNIALPVCEVNGCIIPAGFVGKCLGYWWKGDLSASKSIEENIQKARRAFFHFGSIGVFQGDISPLSSRSVLESCVMPVLLYGSENWMLLDSLLNKLEAFQGELVKRVLKWPKHLSNTAAITVLDVPTIRCRVFLRKLGFLQRVVRRNTDSLSGRVVLALCDDVDSLCLVRECRELDEWFGSSYTDVILSKQDC